MPLRSFTRWRPEDDKRLLELITGGTTPVRAANALRRSLGAIETRLTVLKARAALGDNAPTIGSNAKWTREDEKRLLELKDAGQPTFEIAIALGRSISSVTSRLYLLKARVTKEREPQRLSR